MGLSDVVRIRLKFVDEYLDRHGKVRRYFRRPGRKRVPLPGTPGSKEFREAYEAALADSEGHPLSIGAERTKAGSVSALVAAYYSSPEFKNLAPITRKTYRNEIEHFREAHGEKRVAKLRRDHIKKMLADKSDSPGAANKLLRTIKMLMRFAVQMDAPMRRDDPTFGIKRLKVREGGFVAWDEQAIATFEAHHPVGSRARLALALLLYTAQRRSDVVRMGWQHVRDRRISVVQQKTGAALWIPVHHNLAAILEATPRRNLTFLTTAHGKPFTGPGFGNWFGDCCRQAGLPVGYNAHGLRKAAARRLAEAGCSTKHIMAITGHRSIEEVELYTAAAEQKLLADQAMARIGNDSV